MIKLFKIIKFQIEISSLISFVINYLTLLTNRHNQAYINSNNSFNIMYMHI